ncbi:MAG: hypothetical protein V3V01_09645 [Acidimicrobiales bacterium]
MSRALIVAGLVLALILAIQVWIQDKSFDASLALRAAAAVAFGFFIIRTGVRMLGSFATPVEPPPEPGDLRKVKITYRCDICGTEVRMTMANDQIPEPPRHCLEDMNLTAPIED